MGVKADPPTRERQSKRPLGLSSEDVASPSTKVTGRAARVTRKKLKGGRKKRRLYPDSIPPGMVAEVFDVSSTDEAPVTTAPSSPPVDRRLPPNGLPRPWSKPPAPHPPRPSLRPAADGEELELDPADLEPDSAARPEPVAPLLTPPPMELRVPAGRSSGSTPAAWLLVGAAVLGLGVVIGIGRVQPERARSAVAAVRTPSVQPRAAASSAILIALPEPSPGVLPSEPPAELEGAAPNDSASSDAALAPNDVAANAPVPGEKLTAPVSRGPSVAAAPIVGPVPTADEPAPPFDAEAAGAAIRAAFSRASACRGPNDPRGEVTVTLTYAPSGRVTTATVGGIFAGTSVGGCIAATLRTARVPEFSGPHLTVKRTALIK
jgi:hypothetical protein